MCDCGLNPPVRHPVRHPNLFKAPRQAPAICSRHPVRQRQGLFKAVQGCSRLVQGLLKAVQGCSRLVQGCSRLFKACSRLFKVCSRLVQGLFKAVQGLFKACLRLVQGKAVPGLFKACSRLNPPVRHPVRHPQFVQGTPSGTHHLFEAPRLAPCQAPGQAVFHDILQIALPPAI